jgi:formate-dependent nitrite reductase membrane component NrfD
MINLLTVTYMFLAGMGAGCFLLACAARLFSLGKCRYASESSFSWLFTGFLVGFPLVAGACLFLIADLGQPLRMLLLLTNPATSVISAGTYILLLFNVLAGISLLVCVAHIDISKRALQAICIAGVVLSLGVMGYTAVLLYSFDTITLWHTLLLVILFVVSALSCAAAFLKVIAFCMAFVEKGKVSHLAPSSLIQKLLFVEFIALMAFILERAINGSGSIVLLLEGPYALLFWGGVVLCGELLPALVMLLGKRVTLPYYLIVGACLFVLLGGFLLRYCILFTPI